MGVYWIGLLVGLSIAAPLGPVNVLCIRRTLTGGFVLGLVSGCGAALADTFYGAVAAFGISVVASFLLAHETVLRLGGGLVLCILGARSFRGEVAWPHSVRRSAGSRERLCLDVFSSRSQTRLCC